MTQKANCPSPMRLASLKGVEICEPGEAKIRKKGQGLRLDCYHRLGPREARVAAGKSIYRAIVYFNFIFSPHGKPNVRLLVARPILSMESLAWQILRCVRQFTP